MSKREISPRRYRQRLSAAYECAHARLYGTTVRHLKLLGGAEKLAAMNPDARRLLLAPHNYGSENIRRHMRELAKVKWPK